MEIGEKYRNLRESKGLTQKEAGEKIGWSQHEIVRVEAAHDIKLGKLQTALKGIGMTLADFFGSRIPTSYSKPEHATVHEQVQEVLDAGGSRANTITATIQMVYDHMRSERKRRTGPVPKARVGKNRAAG